MIERERQFLLMDILMVRDYSQRAWLRYQADDFDGAQAYRDKIEAGLSRIDLDVPLCAKCWVAPVVTMHGTHCAGCIGGVAVERLREAVVEPPRDVCERPRAGCGAACDGVGSRLITFIMGGK